MSKRIIEQLIIAAGQWQRFGGKCYEQRFDMLLDQLQELTGSSRKEAVEILMENLGESRRSEGGSVSESITICANEKCESIIHKDQRVWFQGKDLYCHSRCLMTTFGVSFESTVDEKVKSKQERVEMMREVFVKRKRMAMVK